MSNNILNEELSQMKYLFGYKPGKVISEQQVPATKPQVPAPAPAPTNGKNINFLSQLLNAIKTGQTYLKSDLFPKKVITGISLDTTGEGGLNQGHVTFTVLAPTDKTVQGTIQDLTFAPLQGNIKGMSVDNILSLLSQNPNSFNVLNIKDDKTALPTAQLDMADIMNYSGGDKNPKQFLDFVIQLEPQSKVWLQTALQKKATGLGNTQDSQQARKILELLFGPQQTKTSV